MTAGVTALCEPFRGAFIPRLGLPEGLLCSPTSASPPKVSRLGNVLPASAPGLVGVRVGQPDAAPTGSDFARPDPRGDARVAVGGRQTMPTHLWRCPHLVAALGAWDSRLADGAHSKKQSRDAVVGWDRRRHTDDLGSRSARTSRTSATGRKAHVRRRRALGNTPADARSPEVLHSGIAGRPLQGSEVGRGLRCPTWTPSAVGQARDRLCPHRHRPSTETADADGPP